MTRQEIKSLIDNRKAIHGTLTREDLLDIGVAHRQLPKAERGWSWLVGLTGGFRTGESYRNFVMKSLKKQGKIGSRPQGTSPEEQLTAERQEIYKARQLMRDERNALNALLRNEARVERFRELVCESIAGLPRLESFGESVKYIPTGGSEAILMLSDWHVGQDCDNFYNKYNLKIAEERVSRLVDSVIGYCRTFGIETLHVLNLGDLIEGKINNTGRIESNERVLKQLMVATEMMANALNKLGAHIPVVTYRSVTDNHGSIDSRYKDRLEEENLNIVTTWYLKARLDGSKVRIMEDNLDPSIGRFELANGMKVAFFHGHRDPKDRTLQNLVGATHEWTDVVCAGHLHNPAEHVFQDMRFFVNGSLCGTGTYALDHRLFTKPSQKLIVVRDRDFLNIDIYVGE